MEEQHHLAGKSASDVAAWLHSILPSDCAEQPANNVVEMNICGDTFDNICREEDHESLHELGLTDENVRSNVLRAYNKQITIQITTADGTQTQYSVELCTTVKELKDRLSRDIGTRSRHLEFHLHCEEDDTLLTNYMTVLDALHRRYKTVVKNKTVSLEITSIINPMIEEPSAHCNRFTTLKKGEIGLVRFAPNNRRQEGTISKWKKHIQDLSLRCFSTTAPMQYKPEECSKNVKELCSDACCYQGKNTYNTDEDCTACDGKGYVICSEKFIKHRWEQYEPEEAYIWLFVYSGPGDGPQKRFQLKNNGRYHIKLNDKTLCSAHSECKKPTIFNCIGPNLIFGYSEDHC